MGLVPIQALKVTVRRLPEGMVPEKPDTLMVWPSGWEYTRVLELTVDVLRYTVPSWKNRASLAIWTMKVGSRTLGNWIVRVIY